MNEMYVYLGIEDFEEEPEQISLLLGLKPTRIHRKGEIIPGTKIRSKSHSWEFRIDAIDDFDLESLVTKLLNTFPDQTNLKSAIQKGRAQVVCVLFISDTLPSIEFSAETIKTLADLGCGFWLDYYLQSED